MSTVEIQRNLRASSLRDCPRRAVYESIGAPSRERTDRENRFLARGKSVGRDYLVFTASANGMKIHVDSGPSYWVPPEHLVDHPSRAGIIAEKRISWEYGTGHADALIVQTRTILECLSSAHASEAMVRSKLLQAVLYCEHEPDADNVALVILDPGDFSEERIILLPSSRQYKDLRDEVYDRIEEVSAWVATDILPDRVCSKPSEAQSHFCTFAEHCFQGWEAPPLEVLAADADLIEAVSILEQAKRALSVLAKQSAAHEAAKKDAQKIIEAAELPAKRPVQIGPFKVTRTAVQRKATLDWEKAEMAGALEPGMLGAFFKDGASYSTFKAERIEGETEDFGDDAPF